MIPKCNLVGGEPRTWSLSMDLVTFYGLFMDLVTFYGLVHFLWTWSLFMELVTFSGLSYFLWTWSLSMDLVTFYGLGHFLWNWSLSVDLVTFYGLGHFLWTWSLSMDLVTFWFHRYIENHVKIPLNELFIALLWIFIQFYLSIFLINNICVAFRRLWEEAEEALCHLLERLPGLAWKLIGSIL